MKMIYVLSANTDTMEGRGPMKVLGHFADRESAEVVGDESRYYDMGGGQLWQVDEVPLFESDTDYNQWQHDEVKRRALSKLTTEERTALGL